MKKDLRYVLDINLGNAESLINQSLDDGHTVEIVEGCLMDNYRIFDIRLKWIDDFGKKHRVHFDEFIILEKYVTPNSSKLKGYGIKYRGITKEEQEIMDLFNRMYQEFENEEHESLVL